MVAIKKIQVGEKGEVRAIALAAAATRGLPRRARSRPPAAHAACPALRPQGVNVTALREVKLLRELRSPYLVRLLDVLPQKRGINLVRPFWSCHSAIRAACGRQQAAAALAHRPRPPTPAQTALPPSLLAPQRHSQQPNCCPASAPSCPCPLR